MMHIATEATVKARAFRMVRLLVCVVLAALALGALWVPAASARTVYTHPFLESFNGAGSTGTEGPTGPFESIDHLGLDQTSHSLYVFDDGYGGVLDKFDTTGSPKAFSGLPPGVTSASVGCAGGESSDLASDVAVDNSGTATEGRIYVKTVCGGAIHAYEPGGTQLGGNYPLELVGCGITVDPSGRIWVTDFHDGYIGGLRDFTSDGVVLGDTISSPFSCHSAIDGSQPPDALSGYFYIGHFGDGGPNVDVYDASRNYVRTLFTDAGTVRAVAVDSINHHVYVDTGDHVDEFDAATGVLLGIFGFPSTGHGLPNGLCSAASGVAYDNATQKLFVADCGRVAVFGPGETEILPNVVTDPADTQPTTAVLRGHVDPDGGGNIVDCHFEWGPASGAATESTPCALGGPIENSDGNTAVTAAIDHLTEGETYKFRLVSSNGNGPTYGEELEFRAQGAPTLSNIVASDVKSDGATISASVDPRGGTTTYRFEWGTDTGYGALVPVPDGQIVNDAQKESVSANLTGLTPSTNYHFRVVAENPAGDITSVDRQFTTFPTAAEVIDTCPNAHAREQTRASLLLDCRAYELVTPANTRGYDVQSDLVPNEEMLPAYPYATDSMLYSLHYGEVAGVNGNPTNFGLDPYVASRRPDGWVTEYVGMPSQGIPSTDRFGSPLRQADAGLSTFLFGGSSLCSPCFADGTTGLPVRMPGGGLVQGMAGSLNPGPAAAPEGFAGRAVSADGSHLVFASKSQFEPDGNSNGDLSVYERDLLSGTTTVVSKTPAGATMTGPGIGELDISTDGARVVVGRNTATDPVGNLLWHPYMSIAGSDDTVDLAPGSTAGVLYDGMTADGSDVYFTTTDQLLPADSDGSADLYKAEVLAGGTVSLSLLSATGATGNSDACAPVANADGNHWNAAGAVTPARCDVVAFSGGAGVPSAGGAVYFISPERLDGPSNGTDGQPNLYARTGGGISFVATLEPDNAALLHAVGDHATHRFGDFQLSADGRFALFASRLPLTPNADSSGFSQIFRYDGMTEALDCVSCSPTGATPSSDTTLTPQGLNLATDGRVFFTTMEQLVLRDTGRRRDAYEWSGGTVELISTGQSLTDAQLITIDPSAVNAYFFTRETFSPQDENGSTLKIYDARAGGGFTHRMPLFPCQASDECHGPGSQSAPSPAIGTYRGVGGNLPPRKHHRKRRHRKRRHTGGGAPKRRPPQARRVQGPSQWLTPR